MNRTDIITDSELVAFLDTNDADTLVPMVRREAERLCKHYMGWDPVRVELTEYYPAAERGGDQFYQVGTWGLHDEIGGRSNVINLQRAYVLASGLAVSEYAGAFMGQYADAAFTELTLGSQYYLDLDNDYLSLSGQLVRLGATWPKLRGSVKVVYTAGFSATEVSGAMGEDTDYTDASDIRLAVLLTAMEVYNEAKAQRVRRSSSGASGPLKSETVPDYSYTRDAATGAYLQGMPTSLPEEVTQILDSYRSMDLVL